MPIVNCNTCKKLFYARPAFLKMGWGKYCSKKCHYQGMQTRTLEKCFTCQKEILLTPTQIKRSKSKKYFCSKSCQTIWRNKYFSGNKHVLWKGGYSTYRRIMKKSHALAICSRCFMKDKRLLAVHHVDKNHSNNSLRNLAWLCHNCHHLVHNDKVEGQKFLANMARK